MIPTFVFGWPTGKETGDFLALDLGTSHLPLYVAPSLRRPALSAVKSWIVHPNPTDTLTLRWHKPPCLPGDPTGLWQV
jgi:hypothetical protein